MKMKLHQGLRCNVPVFKLKMKLRKMKCGDNKQYSKSKVQRTNTKQEQSNHGPPQKLEVGSGA